LYFSFFFPVGTDAKRDRPSYGTVAILGLCAAFFAVRLLRPAVYAVLVRAAFVPADPSLSGALLSLFLHGGWLHLCGNALYLWIFGSQLEGRKGFLPLAALFLLGGLSGCWIQAWLTPADSWAYRVPVIGASGAVASLLGASLVRFRHHRVKIVFFIFAVVGGLARAGVAHLNTMIACLLWFALQLAQGLAAWGGGGSAIAHGAHLGGFATGVLLSFVLGFHREVGREIHRDRAQRYFEEGEWFAALGEITTHLRRVPEDRSARLLKARLLLLAGRSTAAIAEYQSLHDDALRRRRPVEAARIHREMRVHGIRARLPASALLRAAYEYQRNGRFEEAAGAYEEYVRRFPDGSAADLALARRAELLWEKLGRFEEAQVSYKRLLEAYERSEWRDLAAARLDSMRALTGKRPAARSIRDPASGSSPGSA
jgi:membrane associated rhomboid family serine protease